MDEKNVKLKNMTLPQLEELRERQLQILRNKFIVKKLADNGEQVNNFLLKINSAIKERQCLIDLENKMENLDVSDYVEHMCKMEKAPTEERFVPSKSYPKNKENQSVDVKQRQFIVLKESVELQTEQASRVQEEYVKLRNKDETDETCSESEEFEGESSD